MSSTLTRVDTNERRLLSMTGSSLVLTLSVCVDVWVKHLPPLSTSMCSYLVYMQHTHRYHRLVARSGNCTTSNQLQMIQIDSDWIQWAPMFIWLHCDVSIYTIKKCWFKMQAKTTPQTHCNFQMESDLKEGVKFGIGFCEKFKMLIWNDNRIH